MRRLHISSKTSSQRSGRVRVLAVDSYRSRFGCHWVHFDVGKTENLSKFVDMSSCLRS